MSSADESAIPAFKKRKLQRACDCCRRKKVKCDGPQMPNHRCSRCTARRTECTYLQGHLSQKVGVFSSIALHIALSSAILMTCQDELLTEEHLGIHTDGHRSPLTRRDMGGFRPRCSLSRRLRYVEDLESRLERMERFVSKLCPDTDIAKELDDHQFDKDPTHVQPTPLSERSHASGSRVETPLTPSTLTVAPPTPGSPDNHPHSDEEEGDIDREITEGMRKLSVNLQPFRYHGRSSGMVFIRSAMALKDECTGSRPALQGDRQHPWVTALVEDDLPVFEPSNFPPRDLVDVLVDLYFCHTNCHLPLLHEPTFKKSIDDRQHLRNGGFGATVLLVCAIGSRFTRDPRVLLEDSDHPHSAGWKWFRHVERARRLSFAPAKLHDLQVYALMALFLDGTTAPQAAWAVIGAGVRAALEVGVHRKKMYAPTPNAEEELWRRAFWVLVMLEWTAGYAFGRPCSIHDEDFDLALPTECDDEYWLTSEGEPLFKQPPGKPSKVTAFVCMIRLGQMLAFAMRTIYATNKSRAQLGQSDEQWEQRIVADLDSALNKWADSLPSHLRWDPEQENVLFLTQAATISAIFYQYQIAVHRSFMSSSRRESPISLPSAIICTNAARASIQVAEVLRKRTRNATHWNAGLVFMSAIVLMTNMLGLKRSGRAVNTEKDLALVGKSVEVLRSLRYETQFADSLAFTLSDLMSGLTEPLPPGATISANEQDPATNKAEAEHPSSSVATPLEGDSSPREQRMDGPDTPRWQPTPGDMNNPGAGPSFASFTSAHPGPTLDIPPGLDFPLSDPSSFALPFRSYGLGLPAQGFTLAAEGPVQRGLAEQVPPTRAFPHAGAYGFLHLLQHDPAQPQRSSDASARANRRVGQSQFGGGRMFGLEPLGYNPSMPFPPSTVSPDEGGPGANDRAQAQHHFRFADAAMELGGDPADSGVPDFTLMDDALMMMWSSMPSTSGWDDWGASYPNANDAGT
ncbi:fungal-specific transcription factor domain-containing protein [Ganoderma leucocontextum]|nr:fungal-specific transcription factor domain-containing protein [Ganoderma leucocontextum]